MQIKKFHENRDCCEWDDIMNVNFEFFDKEPLENIITCLNFKMDKVIFFGHSDLMNQKRIKTTRDSLKNICGIEDVKFVELSKSNLYRVLEILEKEIQIEKHRGSKCFFDLTGGEGLILVAMGILSTKYETPLHQYDVWKEELITFNNREFPGIEELVEKRKINLTLDDIISMWGGSINYRQQKVVKSQMEDPAFKADFEKLWSIAGRDSRKWNGLSGVLKKLLNREDEEMNVLASRKEFQKAVQQSSGITIKHAEIMLHQLGDAGILEEVWSSEEAIGFRYKNPIIRECMMDAGCALELFAYYEKVADDRFSDCRVGVHIDWDGDMSGSELDVENEIDVLALEGNIPVFSSCKNGKVNQMALYELETVARRFGGRYVRREMIAGQKMTEGYEVRAEEMGIRVIYV